MKNFNYIIKDGSGRYSNLDKEYNRFIDKTLKNVTDENILDRWDTYNLILCELLKMGENNLFNEIRYRLTDGEDPNEVMVTVIDKLGDSSAFLWLIKKRVESYIEDDFENRFY